MTSQIFPSSIGKSFISQKKTSDTSFDATHPYTPIIMMSRINIFFQCFFACTVVQTMSLLVSADNIGVLKVQIQRDTTAESSSLFSKLRSSCDEDALNDFTAAQSMAHGTIFFNLSEAQTMPAPPQAPETSEQQQPTSSAQPSTSKSVITSTRAAIQAATSDSGFEAGQRFELL